MVGYKTTFLRYRGCIYVQGFNSGYHTKRKKKRLFCLLKFWSPVLKASVFIKLKLILILHFVCLQCFFLFHFSIFQSLYSIKNKFRCCDSKLKSEVKSEFVGPCRIWEISQISVTWQENIEVIHTTPNRSSWLQHWTQYLQQISPHKKCPVHCDNVILWILFRYLQLAGKRFRIAKRRTKSLRWAILIMPKENTW